MRLFLIRHGETEWNRLGRIQGQADIPLNSRGIYQAEMASFCIRNIDFEDVFTSPLTRAKQTAEIICQTRKNAIIVEPLLIEISYGVREGQNIEEIMSDEKNELFNYFNAPEIFVPPLNGESIIHLKKRCSSLLNKLENVPDSDQNILLITHGAFIRGMISVVERLPDARFWDGKEQQNCSTTILEIHHHQAGILREAVDPFELQGQIL